jgi:hypothetical protein
MERNFQKHIVCRQPHADFAGVNGIKPSGAQQSCCSYRHALIQQYAHSYEA